MSSLSERIAQIEELLASGATRVVTDGTDVTIDPESLRRELRSLREQDANQRGRRPVAASINLSGW